MRSVFETTKSLFLNLPENVGSWLCSLRDRVRVANIRAIETFLDFQTHLFDTRLLVCDRLEFYRVNQCQRVEMPFICWGVYP